MEIAEEEEEEEREKQRQSAAQEGERPSTSAAPTDGSPAKSSVNELDPPHFTSVSRPSSPAKSVEDTAGRISSQTSRSDFYPASSYPYSKPRVKLGPRPSVDSGRPRSSAGGTADRPVSTVPAGIKSLSKAARRGRSQSRGQDEEGTESIKEEAEDQSAQASATSSDAKTGDVEPAQPDTRDRANGPAASASELKPTVAPSPSKQNTITPEKARLLKAMKLREKKKMMSLQPALDVPALDSPSGTSTFGLSDEKPDTETTVQDRPMEKTQGDVAAGHKADSAIEMEVSADHASVDTRTDSHSPSPLASSETGGSTQASSLSESTGDTVPAKEQDRSNDGGVDASEPASSTVPSSISSTEGEKVGASPESQDGQSERTITPAQGADGEKEEPPAEAEDKNNDKDPAFSAAPDDGAAAQQPVPVPASCVSSPPDASKGDESNSTPAADATQSRPAPSADAVQSSPETAEGGQTPSPQIRIPVSKFSTQEAKPSTGPANQEMPPTAPRPSEVDTCSVGEAAPPVPEKDRVPETGEGAETAASDASASQRKQPGPIRTALAAQEGDKRRSVASILENDGLMDELQSATVQQATPVTVSKSPMSPLFPTDQASKRASAAPEIGESASRFLRTTSNPVRNSALLPGEVPAGTPRSASSGAAYLQKMPQQQAAADLRPKSAKLGSSISQRIKALEKLSGNTNAGDATPKERPATTFFAVRKASTREPSRSPSVADRANSLAGPTPSPPASRGSSSPEASRATRHERSGSVVNRLSVFEGGGSPRSRPESVQVTARIVRDPNQPFPKAPDSKTGSTDYSPLELKQSPLVVDVHNRPPSQCSVRAPSIASVRLPEHEAPQGDLTSERRLSRDYSSHIQVLANEAAEKALQDSEGRRPRRRSSLSVVKDFIKDRTESFIGAKSPSTDNLGSVSAASTNAASPGLPTSSGHQNVSLAHRLSISSRRSSLELSNPVPSSTAPSPRATDAGAESESDVKSNSGSIDKKSGSSDTSPASPGQSKGSRASRFMRRLSNSLVAGRKNAPPSISPTVAEEDAAEVEAASKAGAAAEPSIVAFMGDVNVQFPDNLLWKRRSICLDSHGFLILSAVQGTATIPSAALGKDKHGALVKRYHMSDFKAPYAPDVELQELPNSVVLDLVDGSGLQIACEDRAGQINILQSEYLHFIREETQTLTLA